MAIDHATQQHTDWERKSQPEELEIALSVRLEAYSRPVGAEFHLDMQPLLESGPNQKGCAHTPQGKC